MAPYQVRGRVCDRVSNSSQEFYRDNQDYPVATGRGPGHICVVSCQSCVRLFVVEETKEPDGTVLWPLSGTRVPDGTPDKVGEAYRDARVAFAAGSLIGGLMAGRVTLTRVLRDIQESRDKSVSQFSDLLEKRMITSSIAQAANQLRLWANVVGHDDIPTNSFEKEDVRDILDYLGTLLESLYTHPARVNMFVARTKELKAGQQNTA